MQITVLIENQKKEENLEREHGLSLLIETDGKKILFDSGQSDKFIDNAKKLGIDLNSIDLAILSHGHYDHSGGLETFLEENDHAPVYINSRAFEKHYHKNRDVGIKNDFSNNERIIFTDNEYEIDNNLKLNTCNNLSPKYKLHSENFYVERDGEKIPEDFSHEQYLEVIEDGKSYLFSGCSHKGILNITDWYTPDVLIGGFHLMDIELDEDGKKHLDRIAEELNAYDCKYYTCHCTGRKQYAYLKEKMNSNLDYLSTGTQINI